MISGRLVPPQPIVKLISAEFSARITILTSKYHMTLGEADIDIRDNKMRPSFVTSIKNCMQTSSKGARSKYLGDRSEWSGVIDKSTS